MTVRLRHQDMRGLIEVIRRANIGLRPSALLESIPGLLQQLLPSEITLAARVNLSTPHIGTITHPVDAISSAANEAFARNLCQHPVFAYRRRTGNPRALRISDFMTLRELRQLPIHAEGFKAIGVNYSLAASIRLTRETSVVVGGNRSRRDYSEGELLLLETLRPHLAQAYRNAVVAARAVGGLATLAEAVESAECGIIALDAAGRPRRATATAERLIRQYFGHPLRLGSAPPERLRAWTQSQAAWLDDTGDVVAPTEPLLVEDEGRRCLIRWIPADEISYLLLDECVVPSVDAAKRSAHPLHLSPREREVLRQVAAGHTDRQIAELLGCSIRTVQKHLERIYKILRVDNRTAAAGFFYRATRLAGRGPQHP